MFFLKIPKINEKEAGVGPFKKKKVMYVVDETFLLDCQLVVTYKISAALKVSNYVGKISLTNKIRVN